MQNKLYEKTMENLLHATETRTSIENNFSKEKLPAYEAACKAQVEAAIKLLNMNADYELKDGSVTILAEDGSLISIPENDIKEKLTPDDFAILFPTEEEVNDEEDFLTDDYSSYKEQEIMPMQSPLATLLATFVNALQTPVPRNVYMTTPSEDPVDAVRTYTDNLKKQNQQLKERLKTSTLETKGLTENNKALNEKITSLEEELSVREKEQMSLKESYDNKVSEFEEKINNFNKDTKAFECSIEELKEKVSVRETRIKELIDEVNEFAEQNKQLSEANTNLEKELQEAKSAYDNMVLDMCALENKVDKSETEKEELTAALNDNKTAYDSLVAENESLSNRILELENELSVAKESATDSDEKDKEIAELNANMQSLLEANKSMEDTIKALRSKNEEDFLDEKYSVKSASAFKKFLNSKEETAKSLVLIQIHDLFELNIRYNRRAGDFAINTVINAFAECFGKESIYKLHGAQIVLALDENNSKALDDEIFRIKKRLKEGKDIKITYSIEDIVGDDKIRAFSVINKDIDEYMKKKLEEEEEIEEEDEEEDSSYDSLITESDGTTVDLSQSVASLFKNK